MRKLKAELGDLLENIPKRVNDRTKTSLYLSQATLIAFKKACKSQDRAMSTVLEELMKAFTEKYGARAKK
jgi:hypothetical protein